ncbi:nitroreductase family protein [Oceanihabitans sediminis]|uniref:nitroreductase family protein n=1 Tax=Oceanihabitans sediminis TaxID=1812012 RepID=UPI003A929530
MKGIVKSVLGEGLVLKYHKIRVDLKNLKLLSINMLRDGRLFYKHSTVFKEDTFSKKESKIILLYHALEKGYLHEKVKYRFGIKRVQDLIVLLKSDQIVKCNQRSQIASAYLSICKYYEIHSDNNIDISDYYSFSDYELFKSLLECDKESVLNQKFTSFFEKSNSDFAEFSKSRMSTRNFSGKKIPVETIKKVLDIARTAPSVCNRQPVRVYYTENKVKIDKIFDIQRGLIGYSDSIVQLLVVVSDRNYFFSVGERNQLYIDGGIFLMNLLYALHYYKIGACPAHWGLNYQQDLDIQKVLNLSDSEKVICLVPIGIPKEKFKTTLSLRRDVDEILKIVN